MDPRPSSPPSRPPVPPTVPEANNWKADVPASIVVLLVALPLCLGIALASGAPLFAGIIAGVVGGIVAGSISGSPLMVSGPAAGLTAIVASAIMTMGSFDAFLVAVVLGGVLQLGLGVARAGIIGNYFPTAVIRGMLTAIGLTLILKQIPHAVGYDADAMGDLAFLQGNAENTFSALMRAVSMVELTAVILSVTALAILVVWSQTSLKRMKLLPAPLVAVVLGVVGHQWLATLGPEFVLDAEHMVALPVPDSVDDLWGLLVFPDWSALMRAQTWTVAITIGIVASLESLLSLEATGRLDPYKREVSADRELTAQGIGNVVSGLLGGLPITGVIVRSSANVNAGARTRMSAILHGVLLAIAVLSIPAWLNLIPLASLAAILLYTGFQLAHPSLVRRMWVQGQSQFVPYAVTVVAILLTDLLVGIGIGLATGLCFVLFDQARYPPFAEERDADGTLRLRFQDQVSFLHKAALVAYLDGLPAGTRVVVDGSETRHIDHDVLELLDDFRERAGLRRVDFSTAGVALPADGPGGH